MKRLYKSSSDKIFLGVLGGLGKALNIEPLILRLLYIVLAFMSPLNFSLLYIIAAIIIPSDKDIVYDETGTENYRGNTGVMVGIGLIIMGIFFLLQNFLPMINLRIIPQVRALFRGLFDFWPMLLIILGIYIIYNQKRQK